MSAISFPKKSSERSNAKSLVLISGIMGIVSLSLFAYLMWYVSPEHSTEWVKIIAVTDNGCIVETLDGFATNIGFCDGNPDDYISATVDQKVKERAIAMNPS
jgi:flagellar basal body-associated protein FliL